MASKTVRPDSHAPEPEPPSLVRGDDGAGRPPLIVDWKVHIFGLQVFCDIALVILQPLHEASVQVVQRYVMIARHHDLRPWQPIEEGLGR